MKNNIKFVLASLTILFIVVATIFAISFMDDKRISISNNKFESFSVSIVEETVVTEVKLEETESIVEKASEGISSTLEQIDGKFKLTETLYSNVDIALLVDYKKCDTALTTSFGIGNKTILEFISTVDSFCLIKFNIDGKEYSTYYDDIIGKCYTEQEYNGIMENYE